MTILHDHNLTAAAATPGIRYDEVPLVAPDGSTPHGSAIDGLHTVHVTLDNPSQLNAYTTDMVRGVILAMRRASNDRRAVAVVLTGAGDRAFCTGGNTKEYAESYAGRPEEYRQYLKLFMDMISSILACDKPVINRVNGMRIAGGQEMGMACDFTVAQDLALFGQAGPRHGSAPDGGSTDFLPLFAGIDAAMECCTLCEHMTAHKAHRLGLITRLVPALEVDGAFVPNPLAITDRWIDGGQIVFGDFKTGAEKEAGKAVMARGRVNLSQLDSAVNQLAFKLANTFPGCLIKTIESVRKHKLEHWNQNRETNRAWLAMNMMTEGRAGFRAFNEGSKTSREADFLLLRRRLAEGAAWGDELTDAILAKAHQK